MESRSVIDASADSESHQLRLTLDSAPADDARTMQQPTQPPQRTILPGLINRASSAAAESPLQMTPLTPHLNGRLDGREAADSSRSNAVGIYVASPSNRGSAADGGDDRDRAVRHTLVRSNSVMATEFARLPEIGTEEFFMPIKDEAAAAAAAEQLEQQQQQAGDSKPLAIHRLTSTSQREASDESGVIAAFAKGDKNMASLARKDYKNRWLVSFSMPIFVEMLIIHIVGPLAIPFVWARMGRWPVINMRLHDVKLPSGIGNIVWLLWVLAWVLFLTQDVPHITLSEILMATLIIQTRNCIIAAKYAYASPGQLSDMQKRAFTAQEVGAWLMISGWAVPTMATQRQELLYALKRTGINVKAMTVCFKGDDADETRLISERLRKSFADLLDREEDRPAGYTDEWLQMIDEGTVPGELLISSLIKESISHNRGAIPTRLVMCATLVHCLIPSLVRLGKHEDFMGNTWAEIVIAICCFMVSFPNFMASVMFVLCGIVDYDRRVFLMHNCSAMLTPSYKIWQTERAHLMPIMSLERPANIAHWLDIRMVLKDFGLQYFMRIQIYSSLWLFFMAGFILYLFWQLVIDTSHTEITSVIIVCWDLLVVMIALVMMLHSAKTLNQQHVEHRRILLKKLNQLQRAVSGCVLVDPKTGDQFNLLPRQIAEIERAKGMLSVVIQVMETEDELNPIKILGINASDNVLRAAVTVAGSAFLAAARVLIR